MSTKKDDVQACMFGLERLKIGNAEHIKQIQNQEGCLAEPIGVTKPGQSPYAAILSCADSRVIPERIFSAGEGELFVVRVAGNIANTSSIASLEYAVHVLGVRIIVVLGHEGCGAVKSAIDQSKCRLDFGANLNDLLAHIVPAINVPPPETGDPCSGSKKPVNDLETGVRNNAKHSAEQLLVQSEILQHYYKEKGLVIFNGYYNVYGKKKGKKKGKTQGKVYGIDKWDCSPPKSSKKDS